MPEATPLAGFEERVARIPSGKVRYFTAGRGPPAVLVHGLGGAASNWSELAGILRPRFRLLLPDLPGHGGSDPFSEPAGVSSFAEVVARLAERERMVPAAVAGHSFGGAVALALALRRPAAVSALVLAAAAGISSSSLRARAGLAALRYLRPGRAAARFSTTISSSPTLKRLVFRMLAADPACLSAEAVHGFLAGAPLVSDSGTAAAALFAEDSRTELGELSCPALVLWGARDWFLSLEDGFEYARRLGAPLRVLPDTGHLLIAERPAECARLIQAWLDGIREVDELPGQLEALGELRHQSLDP